MVSSYIPPNERLTTAEAAKELGIKPNTLEKWRCTKSVEVPYYRIGGRIFYAKPDIRKIVAAGRCDHNGKAA